MEMVIIRIKPILFGWKFEDLTLACKKCGSTKELGSSAVDDPKPACLRIAGAASCEASADSWTQSAHRAAAPTP
jgi:hypothetical protein